jgi:membrane fusion protein (multidrug efflux system)
VGYASYWYWYARYLESTDDCYVNGDVVQITTEIPGTVIQLHVDDTQSVARGQPLLELDPADAAVAASNAEAKLARAVNQGYQLRVGNRFSEACSSARRRPV